MKRKILTGFILGLTAMSATPSAMAITLEDRVKQMEAELAGLKVIILEEKQQTAVEIQALETVIDTKVATAKTGASNLITSKDTTLSYGGFIKVDGSVHSAFL